MILFGQTHQTMWGVARQNEFISTRFRTPSNAMLTLCRRTNLCYWWKQSTATQLSAVITQKIILLRAKCHFCRCCTRKPQHVGVGVVIVAVLVLLLFASWFLCVQRWHKVPTKTKYLMYGNRIGFWPKPHGLWHKQKRREKKRKRKANNTDKCKSVKTILAKAFSIEMEIATNERCGRGRCRQFALIAETKSSWAVTTSQMNLCQLFGVALRVKVVLHVFTRTSHVLYAKSNKNIKIFFVVNVKVFLPANVASVWPHTM